MALSPAPVNQPSFRANPVQSYIANQPYFNQFTGKDVTSSSINRPMSRFSSLTSSEANSFNRYYNTFPAASTWGLDVDNRLALDLTTKKQKEKPDSRQMENKKMCVKTTVQMIASKQIECHSAVTIYSKQSP